MTESEKNERSEPKIMTERFDAHGWDKFPPCG